LNILLEKINRDLKELPPLPSSAPLSEVLRLITDFTREVERQGVGIPGRDGLLHQIKQPQDNFRVAVRRTAPCFVPKYRGRSPPATPASPVFSPAIEESEPEPICVSSYLDRPSASATPISATSASVLQPVEEDRRMPFLGGEEDSDEIGLNDGKKVFIDDVLQTAEWCVP